MATTMTTAPAPAPAPLPAGSVNSGAKAAPSVSARPATSPTSPTSSPPDLGALAATIARETARLEAHLRERGIALAFDPDAPLDLPSLPEDMQQARFEILRATRELRDLVTGPREKLRWLSWDYNDTLSLHAVHHYKMAKAFPPGETATYAQIAATVGLDELNTRRLIRHAMTNRIFTEPEPNVVAHTATSRVLAEDPLMDAWVGMCTHDLWPAAVATIPALAQYPAADEPAQTAFSLANGKMGEAPMFGILGADPVRAKRFGMAMTSLTGGEGYEVAHLLQQLPLADVDARGGTLVDLGGSHGIACIELARRYPAMRFVVQDLARTIDSAPPPPPEVADRVTLQVHDFLTPQPVHGADVYFFRWILHNQSTKYAVRILRQLTPALKPGARLVVNEHCLRQPGSEAEYEEKIIRGMDVTMLSLLNAQERDEADFRALFAEVDKRWQFQGVVRSPRCRMAVVTAVWAGGDA